MQQDRVHEAVFGFKEAGLKLDVTTWSRGSCNQSKYFSLQFKKQCEWSLGWVLLYGTRTSAFPKIRIFKLLSVTCISATVHLHKCKPLALIQVTSLTEKHVITLGLHEMVLHRDRRAATGGQNPYPIQQWPFEYGPASCCILKLHTQKDSSGNPMISAHMLRGKMPYNTGPHS